MIKKLMFIFLFSSTYYANAEEKLSPELTCGMFKFLAKGAVEQRYQGVTPEDITKRTTPGLYDEGMYKVMMKVTLDAHKLPFLKNPSAQSDQAISYSNHIYNDCYRNLTKQY